MNAKEARVLTNATKPKKPADELFVQIRERAVVGLGYILLTGSSWVVINPAEVEWLTDNGYTVDCSVNSPVITIAW